MSRTESKKRIIILAGLALALAAALISINSVYALWSDSVSHKNELVADTLSSSITETFEQGSEPQGEVPKSVRFTNGGSCASFLRIAYSETWTAEDGTDSVILSNKVNGHDVADKHFNWADWTDGGDGWYYYNQLLMPGETSSELLDKVTFPDYTGDLADYASADYELYFRMELLQASDSPRTNNSDDVNSASSGSVWGKEATVGSDGSSVTWN